jgi:hypothetical protein
LQDFCQFLSDFLVEVMAVSNDFDGFLDDVGMVKVDLLQLESDFFFLCSVSVECSAAADCWISIENKHSMIKLKPQKSTIFSVPTLLGKSSK